MRRHCLLLASYLFAVMAPLATAVGTNLEYEFALAASIALLALVPLAAIVMPLGWAPRGEDGRFALGSIPWELFWTFLVAPAAAGGAASLMFWLGACPCSKPGFSFWMAVLFLPALVLAHAVHYGLLRARARGASRLLAALALVAFLIGAAGLTGYQMWVNPQKRLVSLVFGFLHGPIYDDWIAFDQGILLLRISQLCLATALLLLAWLNRQKSAMAAIAALTAGWLVAGHFAREFPSATTGAAALNAKLSGVIEGQGFTLHYVPGKSQKPSLPVQRLFRDTEFHVAELTALFKEKDLPHVEVYVYPSEDQKKLWFGGGSTDVTDVYTPSIHITQGSWPHPTLRHELVHALASGFAYHGLGFHPNMAFTEGLAVALAPSERTLSLDDGTASLMASGRMPDLEDLFSPAFWKVSGGRAYTTAGSLINFLIARYGIDGVKALYSGKSWSDAFKAGQDETLKDWQAAIQKGYDKERNALFTEALFRYPGVFDDECPHSKADLVRSRTESLWVRVRQPIGWNPERDYLPWLLKIDPDDQESRLREWKRDVRKAALDRAEGRLETWRETLSKARKTPPGALEDVEMGLLESDVDRAAGKAEDSKKLVAELAEYGQKKFFGESIRREIEARGAIERLFDDAGAQAWRRYLAGWAKTIPEKKDGEPWLATYLRLRNGQIDVGGAASLKKALDTPVDPALSPSFHVEWYRLLANKLMREGAYADAAFAYRKAAEVTPTAAKDLFLEHARRADFYVAQGPLKADEPPPEDPSSH